MLFRSIRCALFKSIVLSISIRERERESYFENDFYLTGSTIDWVKPLCFFFQAQFDKPRYFFLIKFSCPSFTAPSIHSFIHLFICVFFSRLIFSSLERDRTFSLFSILTLSQISGWACFLYDIPFFEMITI